MRRASRNITVNAPRNSVFEYLADFARHHEWDDELLDRLEPTTEGRLGVDSTFRASFINDIASSEGDRYRVTVEATATLTDFSPPHRMAFKSTRTGRADDVITFRLEPAGLGTRITMRREMTIPLSVWLLWIMALPTWPFIALFERWLLGRLLERISQRISIPAT